MLDVSGMAHQLEEVADTIATSPRTSQLRTEYHSENSSISWQETSPPSQIHLVTSESTIEDTANNSKRDYADPGSDIRDNSSLSLYTAPPSHEEQPHKGSHRLRSTSFYGQRQLTRASVMAPQSQASERPIHTSVDTNTHTIFRRHVDFEVSIKRIKTRINQTKKDIC